MWTLEEKETISAAKVCSLSPGAENNLGHPSLLVMTPSNTQRAQLASLEQNPNHQPCFQQ